MNSLNLAWESFDFYSEKVSQAEYEHSNFLNNLDGESLIFLPKSEKDSLCSKYTIIYNNLNILYGKYIDALSEVIILNNNIIDIPIEREIDTETLLTLKNITTTLRSELFISSKKIFDILS
jgi:hypothetical protein